MVRKQKQTQIRYYYCCWRLCSRCVSELPWQVGIRCVTLECPARKSIYLTNYRAPHELYSSIRCHSTFVPIFRMQRGRLAQILRKLWSCISTQRDARAKVMIQRQGFVDCQSLVHSRSNSSKSKPSTTKNDENVINYTKMRYDRYDVPDLFDSKINEAKNCFCESWNIQSNFLRILCRISAFNETYPCPVPDATSA